jgi:hypothetical protein
MQRTYVCFTWKTTVLTVDVSHLIDRVRDNERGVFLIALTRAGGDTQLFVVAKI